MAYGLEIECLALEELFDETDRLLGIDCIAITPEPSDPRRGSVREGKRTDILPTGLSPTYLCVMCQDL